MISIVIPCIDYKDIVERSIARAKELQLQDNEYIIIDNGSETPYEYTDTYKVYRSESNLGGPLSIKKALEIASNDIVLVMHNDVWLHEQAWDMKIEEAFIRDEKLAIAGFFGSRGIGTKGGRIFPESNMQGLWYGSNWREHSDNITGVSPAVALDGLSMIFRKSVCTHVNFPIAIEDMPLHHFYDKLFPFCAIASGFHVATIGVAFDHGLPEGIHSTANASKIYHESARKWCEERGIELVNDSPDHTTYLLAERLFLDIAGPYLPLVVRDVSTENDIKYVYTALAMS